MVAEANDAVPLLAEKLGPEGVPRRLRRRVVNLPVELDRELELRAEKIRDARADGGLAPELEAPKLPIPQKLPQRCLGLGRSLPQLAGQARHHVPGAHDRTVAQAGGRRRKRGGRRGLSPHPLGPPLPTPERPTRRERGKVPRSPTATRGGKGGGAPLPAVGLLGGWERGWG